MSNMEHHVIVFAPGGWHLAASFSPTQKYFEAAGYAVVGVDLPCIDSENRGLPPAQKWDGDVAAIRETVLDQLDQLHSDYVLVVHSYSGTVGSEAVKGLDRRERGQAGGISCVMGLVYLAGAVLDVGDWLWRLTGGKPDNISVEGDLSFMLKPEDLFYNDLPASEARELVRIHVRSQAWKTCSESKVTYTAWRDIPTTYLLCKKDQAIPIEVPEAMIKSEGGRFTAVRCASGHSPFASMPEFTVEVTRKAAGESV